MMLGMVAGPRRALFVINVTRIHTQEPCSKPAGTGQLSRARQSNHRPRERGKDRLARRFAPRGVRRGLIEEFKWN